MYNHQIGKNLIVCHGRLILGVKEQLFIFISAIISALVVFILFNIFIIPYYFYLGGCYFLIPIFYYISYFIGLLNYVQCFITEPGIIPRNYSKYSNDQEENDKYNIEQGEYVTRPRIYTQRFCYTCNIIRPPKVSHCYTCDNCVNNFDQ
jgi:palmitoyltransferase ZDHHC9/14/18